MQARLNLAMQKLPLDSLGRRLLYARKSVKGWTQKQLAVAAGVNQSDVSKIERGDSQTTVNLLALARALEVAPDWLDTGVGEAPPAMTGCQLVDADQEIGEPENLSTFKGKQRPPSIQEALDIIRAAFAQIPPESRDKNATLLQRMALVPDSSELAAVLGRALTIGPRRHRATSKNVTPATGVKHKVTVSRSDIQRIANKDDSDGKSSSVGPPAIGPDAVSRGSGIGRTASKG